VLQVKSRFIKSFQVVDGSPAAAVLFLTLAHAGIQVGVLCLPLLRLRLTAGVALALVAGAATLAAAVCATSPKHAPPGEPDHRGSPRWLRLLLLCGAIAYVLLFVRAATLPDYSWDGNTYHIPPMNYWARAGYVHWVPVTPVQSELMNGYPKGAELLTWVLTTLLHAPRFVSLANLCFLPLGVAGIASLGECLGASRRIAWACGSLLLFVPVLLWQSVTSYVDCAFGCASIAALALLCQVRAEQESHTVDGRSLLGLGCALGLVCAIKGSGILLAAVSLLGLWIATFSHNHERSCLGVVSAGAACAAVGGHWYLRNYLHTGSPLYPVGLSLAGHSLFPGRRLADILDFAANTPALFARWPAPVRVAYTWAQGGRHWPASSYGWDGRLGGLGYLWLLGCVPSIAAAVARRLHGLPRGSTGAAGRSLLLLAAVVLVAFLGTPLNWWARYTVWIYALGLPCFALVAERILTRPSRLSPAKGWLFAVVALSLCEGTLSLTGILRNSDPGDPAYARAPLPRERAAEGCALFPEAAGTRLQALLLGTANVGVAPLSGDTESGLLIGSLSLPLGARDLVPIPADTAPDFAELRRRRVRYLLYEATSPLPRLPGDQIQGHAGAAGFQIVTLR
jgi:hypothetical protein